MAENAKEVGALEFEVLLKNNSIQKQAEQTKEIIVGIAKSAEAVSESVDNVADSTKKSVADAGKQLDKLDDKLDEVGKDAPKVEPKVEVKPAEKQIEKLEEKIDEVGEQQPVVEPKIETDQAKKDLSDLGEAAKKGLSDLDALFDKTQGEINSLEKELDEINKKLKADESAKGDSDIQQRIIAIQQEIKAYKNLQSEIVAQKDAIQNADIDGKIDAITAALKKMKDAGEDGSEQFKKLDAELEKLKGIKNQKEQTEQYNETIQDAILGNSKFGSSILNLAKSGKGVNGLFDGMKLGVQSFGKALMGLLANPAFLAIAGVAAVAAGFKWWYDYNKGVEQATRLTKQLTDLSGSELKDFRAEVQAVADTFGKEFDEVLLATNALSKQMGISVQDAMKAVKDGFVLGADANGEFIDTLKEYPAYFKEAGLSAEQFVAITTKGVKEGVFSDKAVDTIKEANLRLREMPQATKDALTGIGLSSDAIMKSLRKGEKSTFDVMQEISKKLSELPDSASEVGTAIADIFGGPGEDAGLQFLRTIKDIDGNLENMKKTAGETTTLQDSLLQSNIELEQKIAEVFDHTGGVFERLTTNAKIFLNDALIWIIDGIKNWYNGFVDVYNGSEKIRVGFVATGLVAKKVFGTIWETLKGLYNMASAFGDYMSAQFWGDEERQKQAANKMIIATAEMCTALEDTWTGTFQQIEDAAGKQLEKIEKDTEAAKDKINQQDKKNNTKAAPKTLEAILEERKKAYEDYSKAINSTDEKIVEFAQKNAKNLLKAGADWEEYLNNLREKYKGNAKAIKLINAELIEIAERTKMDIFSSDVDVATEYARNITEQLQIIQNLKKEIADNDPLKGEKNTLLDNKLIELGKSAELEIAAANKEYKDFQESRLKESQIYAKRIAEIEIAQAKATSEEEKQILADQIEATTARYNLAQAKEQIESAETLTKELVEIETERQRAIEEVRKNSSLDAEERAAEIARLNQIADAELEMLKAKYEIEGVEFSETLQKNIANAMSKTMAECVEIIPDLERELAKLDPNTDEYRQLSAIIDALKKRFDNLKKAQDKNWKDLSKKQKWKKIADNIGEIGSALSSLADQFSGTTSEIMKMVGGVFTATTSIITGISSLVEITTKSIEGVSQTAATAIRAVESASVILAIVEAAMQVAMALINMFKKNKETYADKKDVYDAYISTLDKIIEREKELTKTLEAQQAVAQFDAVGEMIKKQDESTRRIAKEYLTSREKGEHTKGMQMADKINKNDWAELESAVGSEVANKIKNGNRLTDLFDLSAEDLLRVQKYATGFYSKLDSETRGYIDNIIGYSDAMVENTQAKMEQINGISFENFADNFISALEDMDASAADISADISDQMRRALIQDMFKRQYAEQLDEYYKAWYEDAKDGEIDNKEYLDGLRNSIVNGAVQSAQQINDMFRDTADDLADNKTLSGAIKGASQESIDLLAGQTNAVRINQVESLDLLRQQIALGGAINDSIIRNGLILSEILSEVKSQSQSNLRAQGLEF